MSEESPLTQIDEGAMQAIHTLSELYLHAVEEVAGRQIKVFLLVAPTTPRTQMSASSDGQTQVQIMTNMAPTDVKKVMSELDSKLDEKAITQLRDQSMLDRLVRSAGGRPN